MASSRDVEDEQEDGLDQNRLQPDSDRVWGTYTASFIGFRLVLVTMLFDFIGY